ncbi:ATP-dependent RNA helicase DeaD [Paenibacillus sp. CF384]|nr:DEAD/DEAH box helicase [Paenibacillus sp. CF384]SDY02738.1 ATP-dependent RNA helicase DeaD [Paenibacillus sp. CF384]
MAGFEQLGIARERTLSLQHEGIHEATPIQEGAIPVIMQGSDVICQAQTGTGKTLAFLLPMLEKIRPEREELQGLILTPTRELALQITTELKKRLATKDEFSVLAVYGGQDVESQLRKLKRAVHIVVATPGRLLDHIRRGTVKLGSVKMLVLDEADQMLHMGFLTEVEEILSQMPYRKQTMLFSATMPGGVRSLAQRFMIEPKDITVRAPQVTLKAIRQLTVEVGAKDKMEQLQRLLGEYNPYLGVIFVRTKKRASALNEFLQENGFNSDELHGDLTQSKREQVMKKFRDAKIHLLVATDVAARGLDVEGITHVFNFDIPENAESYIHRIGRTGRAGEDGLAITLVSPHDRLELAAIEKGINQPIPREKNRVGAPIRTSVMDDTPDRQGGGARKSSGASRRGGTSGQAASGKWENKGGRSGQQGRKSRSGFGGNIDSRKAGSGGGAYGGAAKRGESRGAGVRGSGAEEAPQWGAARAEAPRGRGGAGSRDGAAPTGRGRYSTPSREDGGRGEFGGAGAAERSGGREGAGRGRGGDSSRGRGASAGRSEFGGGGRGESRGAAAPRSEFGGGAGAPQFPNGGGDKNRARSSSIGRPSSGGGRSSSGGRSSAGGGFKGGRSSGGKQGSGGRPQRKGSR